MESDRHPLGFYKAIPTLADKAVSWVIPPMTQNTLFLSMKKIYADLPEITLVCFGHSGGSVLGDRNSGASTYLTALETVWWSGSALQNYRQALSPISKNCTGRYCVHVACIQLILYSTFLYGSAFELGAFYALLFFFGSENGVMR